MNKSEKSYWKMLRISKNLSKNVAHLGHVSCQTLLEALSNLWFIAVVMLTHFASLQLKLIAITLRIYHRVSWTFVYISLTIHNTQHMSQLHWLKKIWKGLFSWNILSLCICTIVEVFLSYIVIHITILELRTNGHSTLRSLLNELACLKIVTIVKQASSFNRDLRVANNLHFLKQSVA